MVLVIGDNHDFNTKLTTALLRRGIPCDIQRFADRADYNAAEAFIIDLSSAAATALRERLRFASQLQFFHAKRPLFALTDHPHQGDPRELLTLDWAGIFAPRWGVALLAACITRALRPRSSVPTTNPHLTLSADGVLALSSGPSIVLSRRMRVALALLMQHSGEVVNRERIANAIWGTDFLHNERSVDGVISHLRKRLREALGVKQSVRTVSNNGYLFAAARDHLQAPATLEGLLAVGFDDHGWQELKREAQQLRIPAHRWQRGGAAMVGSFLLVVHADATSFWLPHLRAALSRHRGSPALLCDGGANAGDLRSALRFPEVQLCRFKRPERWLRDWLAWALRHLGARFHDNLVRLEMLTDAHAVRIRGVMYALRPKEFAVLALLIANAERIVPRATILETVWAKRLPENSRSLDVRVSQVRRFLAGHAERGRPSIETLPGNGYRLRL